MFATALEIRANSSTVWLPAILEVLEGVLQVSIIVMAPLTQSVYTGGICGP